MLSAGTLLAFLVGALVGAAVLGLWATRRDAARQAEAERSRQAAERSAAEAEQRAAGLGARLAAVEGLVGEGLLYFGPSGALAGASPSARAWFDLDRRAASPSAMAILRSAELVEVAEAARRGEPAPRRVRHQGRTLWADAAVLPDDGVVLSLRDETDLERLARARRDLVANVSHDLRTPLTSIGLMLDALAGGALAQPELAERLLAQITEQVTTLNALVEDLLDLDRLESGHALLQLRPTALDEVLHAAAAGLMPQIEQRGLSLSIEVSPGLRALADAPHVQRLVTNLLDNAVRYSPNGSRIWIGAAPGEGEESDLVVVTVTDEGPGIPPADLERVFERFYRSDRARAGGGSGLGLAIARHIVEGHGGTIRALNRPGGGTEVRFTLPAAPPSRWVGSVASL
jgi:two-component system phosphate regulon sensor histidine kinase PhoR